MNWRELASAGKMADAVVEYVRLNDWVTFAELVNRFDEFLPWAGDYCIESGSNFVIWSGMSAEWSKLLAGLVASRRIHYHPTNPLTYFYDGMVLELPVVSRPPKRGYRTPHWCPVCLRVVPFESPARPRANRKQVAGVA